MGGIQERRYFRVEQLLWGMGTKHVAARIPYKRFLRE